MSADTSPFTSALSQLEARVADPHLAPDSRGLGVLVTAYDHSLREVKWGTDPFLCVRDTVEFQCPEGNSSVCPNFSLCFYISDLREKKWPQTSMLVNVDST